ncbi:MAG TPA: hypothetical protein VGS21_06615, partial [Acidimicrobiales bacterium]|nr:hypothetical protein [Acidimicrobiales bacterium]
MGESEAMASNAPVLRRDAELRALRAFLASSAPPRTLALVGEPGIGKSVLWAAGVDIATSYGLSVLATQPHEAGSGQPFAALADLVRGVEDDVFAELPVPQAHAIDV